MEDYRSWGTVLVEVILLDSVPPHMQGYIVGGDKRSRFLFTCNGKMLAGDNRYENIVDELKTRFLYFLPFVDTRCTVTFARTPLPVPRF